jgi:serine/threonine protein kinase
VLALASMDDSEPQVRPGQIVAGKYRIERVLGAGAMGVVLSATHIELHERRAIKLMLPSLLLEGDIVERFLREARAVAKLKTEHVARVYDVGRLESGLPYIVMEHLEGRDLKAILDERKLLPVGEACLFIRQACDALSEAHALGIVHRDLKPANLFVTHAANGAAMVKVLDFGVAKLDKHTLELTSTGAILGSPLYMSPEQMRNATTADARSDIWSLGTIFYRMLCGQNPFNGESLPEICSAVLSDPPAPIDARALSIPAGVMTVVFRCLEKNPSDRYQTVAELAAALGRIDWSTGEQPGESSLAGSAAQAVGWSEGSAPGAAKVSSWRGRGLAAAGLLLAAGAVAVFAFIRDPRTDRGMSVAATDDRPSSPPVEATPVVPQASAAATIAALPDPAASATVPPLEASSAPPVRAPNRTGPARATQPPTPPAPPPKTDAFGKDRK